MELRYLSEVPKVLNFNVRINFYLPNTCKKTLLPSVESSVLNIRFLTILSEVQKCLLQTLCLDGSSGPIIHFPDPSVWSTTLRVPR